MRRILLALAALLFAAPAFTQTSTNARQPLLNGHPVSGALNLGATNPSILVSPTGNATSSIAPGNPADTLSSASIQGIAVSSTKREILFNCGLTSTVGYGSPNGADNKVCGYFGIVGSSNTGSVWALNTLTNIGPLNHRIDAQGIEVDFNNGARDYGAGDPNLIYPIATGLQVTGYGFYASTAAITISGTGSVSGANPNAIWHAGLVNTNVIAADGAFLKDYGNGHNASLDIRGLPVYGVLQRHAGVKNYFAGSMEVHGMTTLAGGLSTASLTLTADPAWTTWTPSVGASSGSFTALGAVAGAYKLIGKTCFWRVSIPITTNGTASGSVIFTLPVPIRSGVYAIGVGRETALSGTMLQVQLSGSSAIIVTYANGYPGSNGATLVADGEYETN